MSEYVFEGLFKVPTFKGRYGSLKVFNLLHGNGKA